MYVYREKDEWEKEVEVRLAGAVSDLHAADVRYHDDCRKKFMGKRNVESSSKESVEQVDHAFDATVSEMISDRLRIWSSVEVFRKLTEIVILWVHYTIPFGFSLIWHFLDITFQLLNYFVWLRITDEGSLPEMRIWSILLIISDLKWCIYLSRSLFPYFNYLVSVTAGGPRSPRGHV